MRAVASIIRRPKKASEYPSLYPPLPKSPKSPTLTERVSTWLENLFTKNETPVTKLEQTTKPTTVPVPKLEQTTKPTPVPVPPPRPLHTLYLTIKRPMQPLPENARASQDARASGLYDEIVEDDEEFVTPPQSPADESYLTPPESPVRPISLASTASDDSDVSDGYIVANAIHRRVDPVKKSPEPAEKSEPVYFDLNPPSETTTKKARAKPWLPFDFSFLTLTTLQKLLTPLAISFSPSTMIVA